MVKKDHITGIVILLFGIVVLCLAMSIPVRPQIPDPGSRLFPMIGSIGMIVCGLGIILTASKEKDAPFLTVEGRVRLVKVSALLAAYVFFLKYIGFLIASPVMVYMITTLFAYEKKLAFWKKALFSVVVTLLVWLLFEKVLFVMLPSGRLLLR